MRRKSKKMLSIFLAVLMAVTGIMPAVSAFAGDGVEGYWDTKRQKKSRPMFKL